MSTDRPQTSHPGRLLAASLLGLTTLFSAPGSARAQIDERSLFEEFFDEKGEAAVEEHFQWHQDHAGHTHPGAGTDFLSFHHNYIRKYELWRAAKGLPPIPMWNPGTAIPTDIPHSPRNPTYQLTPTPTWATRTGGTLQSPLNRRTRLAEFQTSDELGRDVDRRWHGDVHVRVGGDMATADTAPRDPLFWRWHKYIDGIYQEWRQGQARADFNLDFAPDVLWYDSQTGETSVWLTTTTTPVSSGSVSFLAFDQRSVQHPDERWQPIGTGDFDGDRKSDVVWRNQDTNETAIWLMDGTSAKSQASLPALAAQWQVQAINDFNGDGNADLLWRNPSTGGLTIWRMNGSAVSASSELPAVAAPSQVVASADFDRNGNADLVWRNPNTGETWIAFLAGGSTVAGQSPPLSVARTQRIDTNQPEASSSWEVAGTGDFDGDLVPDLVLRNKSAQSAAIWLMAASGVKARAAHAWLPPTFAGPAIVDLDADGKSDLVWHNEQQVRGPSAGLSIVWHMNGTQLVRQQTLAPMPITARIVPVK